MQRALLIVALLASIAGCPSDRPRVAFGTRCNACSMTITDARFACVRRDDGRWKSFDSIECLLRDGHAASATVRLADYDTRRLVPADSLWLVQGDLPTPMGGGLAAFAGRAASEQVASETHGTVRRFAELSADDLR